MNCNEALILSIDGTRNAADLYAAHAGGGKSTLMTVIVLNAKAKRLSKRKLKRAQQAGRLRTVLMSGYDQGLGSGVSAWAGRTTMAALFGQIKG